jgi:hypothetical protein
MNCKKNKYNTLQNYWLKEDYFVSYAVRGPIYIPNMYNVEQKEDKISYSSCNSMCGI